MQLHADEIPLHSCLVQLHHNVPTTQSRIRPRMQFSVLSPSGNFRIHYDTLGINAVPTADRDGNGIPDFVDSAAYYMDAALRFACDTLGYRIPPRDYVDSSSWDVYLVQLGCTPGFFFDDRDLGQFGWYGATYAEDLVPTPCGGIASTGFIFLDNDYSSADSIGTVTRRSTYTDTGVTALKITCYHEFHHLVQYGYAYGFSPTYYEMTSVWIEQRAFPSITNYTHYVQRLFANPTLYCLSCDRSIEGSYGYSIVLRYLALQLGDSLIRSWWEGIGKCSQPPIALDSVISSRGGDFRSLWCSMLPWLYWTGSRAREGFFPDAAVLPELQPENGMDDQVYTEPSWTQTTSLYPLQFKMLRATLPSGDPRSTADTADFLATNPAIRELASDGRRSTDYSVRIVRSGSGEPLGTSPYRCTRTMDTACDVVIFRSGLATAAQQTPFPNPLVHSLHRELFLPVPAEARAGDRATVALLSSDGIEVFRTDAAIELNATGQRSIRLVTTAPNFPTQGIFVVVIRSGEASVVTKLAVLP
ncbi:hypothetical protein HRbin20_00989 [bacterium HR20]|nr:hypothetical protein HRbin20_00989 [bacterium HR20]